MGHKCFISFKKEDQDYRDRLDNLFEESDLINKSLDRVIDSDDAEYIMWVIRNDYLRDSTVTIFLIGEHSSEREGDDYRGRPKNYFIERELAASLYNGKKNSRNGILGIVLPCMYERIYKGSQTCSICGDKHRIVSINDNTVIREFSQNYYLEPHTGCAWSEEERYCVLAKWDDFNSPEKAQKLVEKAFEKRSSPIADEVVVYVDR